MSTTTCGCGRAIAPPAPDRVAVMAGGWCAPSELLYETMPKPEPICSDCRVRILMIMEIGIDPGRDGENLRVKRGGIRWGALP